MQKPSLDDHFLYHDFLELGHLDQADPPRPDMASSPSGHDDSPRRRRGNRPESLSEGSREVGRAGEEVRQQNHGHWLVEENRRYHWFLEIHYQHFVNSHMRRTDKIFKTMEQFIGSRQAEQCRSHHQKMEKKYINFTNILLHFRQEYYRTLDPTPMQDELDSLRMSTPDGLADEQQLAAYRLMQEDARRKYGRKRMWRRSVPEKHPTPTTQPPELPSEVIHEEEQAPEEEGEAKEEERGPVVPQINMFDDCHSNIGEISVFNEKEELSCLFHSCLYHP